MSLKSLVIPSLNRGPLAGVIPPVAEAQSIPRIIHQTYYSHELPPQLAENVARLKRLNPGWEYRFYTDEDIVKFISENYPPDVLRYYELIDKGYGAARADLFRYLLMYKVGGAYLDIKSTALKPLDTVLQEDDRFLLSTWNNSAQGSHEGWGTHYELRPIGGTEYQQWYIISAAGHPFMRSVIENVIANIRNYLPSLHGTGKPAVLRVTGPIAYSLAIHSQRAQHAHRIVESERDLGLQYSVFQSNTHKAAFKSHYSTQTHPLIKLKPGKRYANKLFHVLQAAHNVATRMRERRSKA